MTLKKEFEKLVMEANQKITLQNKKKEAEETKLIKELQIRQKKILQILGNKDFNSEMRLEE